MYYYYHGIGILIIHTTALLVGVYCIFQYEQTALQHNLILSKWKQQQFGLMPRLWVTEKYCFPAQSKQIDNKIINIHLHDKLDCKLVALSTLPHYLRNTSQCWGLPWQGTNQFRAPWARATILQYESAGAYHGNAYPVLYPDVTSRTQTRGAGKNTKLHLLMCEGEWIGGIDLCCDIITEWQG